MTKKILLEFFEVISTHVKIYIFVIFGFDGMGALLAQWLEHWSYEPGVTSSNLVLGKKDEPREAIHFCHSGGRERKEVMQDAVVFHYLY